MSIEIRLMLSLSTAHLTPEIGRELDHIVAHPRRLGVLAAPHWQSQIVAERWSEYGWFIWVGSEGRQLMPTPLAHCLDFAERMKADWIQFDCDCEPIEELNQYPWDFAPTPPNSEA